MRHRLLAGAAVVSIAVVVMLVASRPGSDAARPGAASHDTSPAGGLTILQLVIQADRICGRNNFTVDAADWDLRTPREEFVSELNAARVELRQLEALDAASEAAGRWHRFIVASADQEHAMERYAAAGINGEANPTVLKAAGRYYRAQAEKGQVAVKLNMGDCAVTVDQRHRPVSKEQFTAALDRVCFRTAAAFNVGPRFDQPHQLHAALRQGDVVFGQFIRDTASEIPPRQLGGAELSRWQRIQETIWTNLKVEAAATVEHDRHASTRAQAHLAKAGAALRDEETRLGLELNCDVFDQEPPQAT